MIGQTISHYKILEKLGEGGMGVVYKAHDTKLDRLVALKFLPPHLVASEQDKSRFIQEAKAASALNHPNVCTIHDIQEYDGQQFIVMEYVEGETIKSKIESEKLTLEQIVDFGLQISEGLKAAHKRDIIHRDIKSENIMVLSDGRVKIMDFGLAKLKGSIGLTRSGSTVGTIGYMSPEQIQGEEVEGNTDIWSLGIVLYEMLTGKMPFKAEHEAALMYLIVNQQPLVPSALDPMIPHRIDSVVMKMLEKGRGRRFQSMEEVLKILQELRTEMETTAETTKAIAVLPFENISPEKESDYFSDGLTEELIASLSRLKDVRVVSRTTSMQYKGTKKDIKTIGRELAVRYILEGSVRKFQDNLRITAQLIDVENDTHLWAETYKGKLADVFDIQEEVSKQIVDALRVKLTPTEKVGLTKRSTLNAEALDCYLRARNFLYRLTKNNIQFAIQLFQKAIELDRRYARAYAGLAEAYATLYREFERRENLLEMAIESALKALMYDSTLSEAYAALGLAYFNKGSLDEALIASQKAIELDPNNFIGYWLLADIYYKMDQDRKALEMYKEVITLNPLFYPAYGHMRMVYERLGEREKYNEILQAALAKAFPQYLSQHPDDSRAHMFFAMESAEAGYIDQANKELSKALELSPGDPFTLYDAACFYARRGEKRLAIDAFKNALTAGYAHYEWIKRDPDLKSIRDEPEYSELMKEK